MQRKRAHAGQLRIDREKLKARARVVNAYSLLFLAQICMSSGGIFGRFALNGIGPMQTAALRMCIASLPLLLRLIWVRSPRTRWQLELQLGGAGLALAVVFGAWTASLMRLSVGASTLLTCCAPFWNGLYESLILKRRSPPSFWVALVVAIGSLAVMVRSSAGVTPIANQAGIGVAFALSSSLAMSIYYIIIRRVSKQHSYHTFDIITRTYGWAAVTLTLMCVAFERTPLPPLYQWQPWAGVLGLAAITQACGHTLQNFTLKVLRPSVVSFAALSEPLIAAVLAIFIFAEAVTADLALGGGTLLLALGWAMYISFKASDATAQATEAAVRKAS